MQLARVAATAWALAALRLVLDPAALARVGERRARPEAAGRRAAHPPLEAPARARVARGTGGSTGSDGQDTEGRKSHTSCR